MGSFGLLPGPVHAVSLNHPERNAAKISTKTHQYFKNSGKKAKNDYFDDKRTGADQDSIKPTTAKKMNLIALKN